MKLRDRARARAFMGSSGQRVMLLTLTLDVTDARFADPRNRAGKAQPLPLDHAEAYAVRETVRYAAWAWNRFRTYLVREYGPVAYFKGLELTKKGVAHVHVLVRVADAHEFLRLRSLIRGPEAARARGLAVRAGFGKVVDAQLARSGGDVARYVTKAAAAERAPRCSARGARALTPHAVATRVAGPAHQASAYVTKGLAGRLPRFARRSTWSQKWAPRWVRPTRIAGFSWRLAAISPEAARERLVAADWTLSDPGLFRIAASSGG